MESYLNREGEYQSLEIERSRHLYRNGEDLPELGGRTVLIVDDGVATGSTVIASVRGIRALGPARIVVAIPVGSPQAVDAMNAEADEVVALSVPQQFRSVGEHYMNFTQVDDDEVVAYLIAARTGGASAG